MAEVKTILTIYPPQSATAGHPVSALTLEIERNAQFPARLTASFVDDWSRDSQEDGTPSAAFPIQQRAYVTVTVNGVFKFRGRITRVDRDREAETVSIEALDKMQVLNETYCTSADGAHVFSRYSESLAITAERLWPGYYFDGGFRDVWYPDPGSDAWLTTAYLDAVISGGYKDTLGANINNSVATIKLSQTNKGFPPSGFISIGTEWIQYNGYTWKESDGFWYIHNAQRGRLGTTAASHTAADVVYPRLSQRISFDTPRIIEGTATTSYVSPEAIQNSHFKVNEEDGSFAFNQPPLELRRPTGGGAASYAAIWSTYAVYDEDGAGVVLLSDFFTEILEADAASLGPEFVNGGGAIPDTCDNNVALTPDIPVTRIVIDKPTYTLEVIKGILQDVGLNKGVTNDAIIHRYNPETDALDILTLAQKATPDRRYYYEGNWTESVSTDDVRSAYLVRYQGGSEVNLCGSARIWHQPCDDASNPAPTYPIAFHKLNNTWDNHVNTGAYDGGAGLKLLYPDSFRLVQSLEATESNANLLTDNDSTTGLAIMWDAAAAPTPGVYFYAWFPGSNNTTPDSYFIQRLTATFEVIGAGASASTNAFDVAFYYSDTYAGSATSSPPTVSGLKPLGANSRQIFSPGTANFPTFTIDIEGIDVFGRGIVIEFNQFLYDSAAPFTGLTGFKLLDLAVYGAQYKEEIVSFSAAYVAGDSKSVTAPETVAKLRDSSMGQHIAGLLDVGPATREVALNLGFLQLLQSAVIAQIRNYTIESEGINDSYGGGIPMEGETVLFSDGFSGVVDTVSYSEVGGARRLAIRVINYDTTLFGATQ